MFRRFFHATALLLVLTLLVTVLPTPVARAATLEDLGEDEAVALLQEFQIVRGDDRGNVGVNERLTRAQAAALFVRAVGMEHFASLLKDAVPFNDAKGHWAAGEIAMAEKLGLMKGDPSGSFRPEDDITYVEVLTVLLRMVEKEPAGQWDADRIANTARSLGVAPPGVDVRTKAIRGKIFWSLAATMTEIPVGTSNLLNKHYDSTPPILVLDRTSLTTQDDSITITGTAVGARKVTVQGRAAQFDRKTGKFSAKANLNPGDNTIPVEAIDYAGNKVTDAVAVERKGTISRITIKGPTWVAARSNTPLEVEARDSKGNIVALDGVEAEVTDNLATFDVRTSTLRAGSAPGKGTLTLRAGTARATYSFTIMAPNSKADKLVIAPVNGDRAPALGQEVTVTVQVVDETGRLLTDDYGRTVTLRSQGVSGVTITPVQPVTEKGVATFKLSGTKVGALQLQASTSGLNGATKDMEILSGYRVVLSTTAKALTPDGVTKVAIKATLQDENGRAVNNTTNADMQILLTATGTDGTLIDPYLTIPRGKSVSTGNDGEYQLGIVPGTVTVKGEFTSSHTYSIQTLPLPVTGALPGSKLSITATPTSTSPNGTVTLKLQVLDGSNKLVTTGSYAFQLKVTTSNNDPVDNGIPQGVTLTFQNSTYTAVDDGRAPTDPLNNPYSIVGRTEKGVATFTLRYNRSGTVTVTPVLRPSTYEAYNPDGGIGPASASTQLYGPPTEVTFSGSAHHIELTVDSDLGANQLAGATNTTKQMKVRAKVVDSTGAIVPNYNSVITLARLSGGNGVSNIVGLNKRNAVNGIAEFTIQTTTTGGWDLYRATAGTLTSQDLPVSVNKTKPEAPTIVAIRGISEGDLRPVTGFVEPDHDYMDIQLMPQDSFLLGSPSHWVTAKVFRKGESREFFKSGAIDLGSPMPVIRIPKSALKVGDFYYEVIVNNGAGDSARSVALDDTARAMNSVSFAGYKLNSATYDAATGKLTLSGSFVTNGVVEPSLLTITKDANEVNLQGAKVQSVSSSSIVLLLESLADAVDPNLFYGTVNLKAQTGWFGAKDGSQIAGTATVTITPMAVITHAAIDPTNKYLYLYGAGFRQSGVTWSTDLIRITGSDGQSVKLNASNDRVRTDSATTDSQAVITLSANTLTAMQKLNGPLYLTADVGWLRSGTALKVGAITGTDHPVYMHVKVNTATYTPSTKTLTLSGSGFEGATVDPSKLQFKRTNSNSTWSPTNTAPVVATEKGSISIVLDDADASAFMGQYSGRNIFVNTLDGWLIDGQGREAMGVPDNSVLLPVPAK